MIFSLFGTAFHEVLGLTYLQINTIASLLALGMYLCNPVLGYFADCYGPASLSLVSVWLFCPSYFINAILVRSLHENSLSPFYVYSFGIAFSFIGLATSSLYFSSLLTCAKIYPHRKGLAISLPITCYGVSSLIGSQLMKLPYFKDGKFLDLNRVFTFFAGLYLFIGILNFVSISIVSIESDIIFEETRLLEDPETEYQYTANRSNSFSAVETHEHDLDLDSDSDDNSLLPQRSIVEPVNHRQRFLLFIKDPSAWLLLVSLMLNLGPLEAFQNNLGSIVKNLSANDDISNQLSVLATSSTVARLLIGGISDYLASPERKWPLCRIWLLAIAIAFGVAGQFSATLTDEFTTTTALNGASYGGIFTLYPTVVATIWGVDMMGTTWGSFMVAPAIGSVSYSLLYGKLIDSGNLQYVRYYFQISGYSILLSLVCVLVVWKGIWWNRGFKLF